MIRSQVKAHLLGSLGTFTEAATRTTSVTATEKCYGQTALATKVNGWQGSSMDRAL